MRARLIAIFGVVLCLALLCVAAWSGKDTTTRGWRDARAFRGGSVALGAKAQSADFHVDGHARSLRLSEDGRSAFVPDEPLEAITLVVRPSDPQAPAWTLHVSIVPPAYAMLAAVAALGLLTCVALLWAANPRGSETTASIAPLTELLSEPEGGLSLGRIQLLIWIVVTVGLFAALALPLLELPVVDTSFAALLGLSGLTTALGAASSPSPQPGASIPEASLRHAIEDWRGDLDISRMQCLVFSVIGALSVVAAFVSALRVPVIPTSVLALLGASQATYLSTKAVKGAK